MTRGGPTALVAGGALAALLGCRPPSPAPRPVSVAAASVSTRPPPSPPPSPELAIREATRRGALHRPPILLDGRVGTRQTWLALLGAETAARAAWLVHVDGERASAEVLPGFPRGATFVGHLLRDGVLHLLLTSSAALDQPAGLPGVYRAFLDARPRPAENGVPVAIELAAARTPEDLSSLLDTRSRVPSPHDTPAATVLRATAARAALGAAAASERAWREQMPRGGIDLVRVHQGIFPRFTHLDAGSRSDAPGAARAQAIARAVGSSTSCLDDVCIVDVGDGTRVAVALREDEGKLRVHTIVETDPTTPLPATPAMPTRSSSLPPGELLAEVLREQDDASFRVLAETALGGEGRVGVALLEAGPNERELRLVLRDGEQRGSFSLVVLEADAPLPEVRFADLDGDARPDVVMRTKVTLADKVGFRHQTFVTPRSFDAGTLLDAATMLGTLDARTIDEATDAALRLPTRGARRADVCGMLARLRRPADVAPIAEPGARLVRYDEPGNAWFHHVSRKLVAVDVGDLEHLTQPCDGWVCDATRPACWISNPPGFDVLVLGWHHEQVRVAGALIYTGS